MPHISILTQSVMCDFRNALCDITGLVHSHHEFIIEVIDIHDRQAFDSNRTCVNETKLLFFLLK